MRRNVIVRATCACVDVNNAHVIINFISDIRARALIMCDLEIKYLSPPGGAIPQFCIIRFDITDYSCSYNYL